MKKTFENYLLIFILSLLCLNALYGGITMILSPDGSMLGMKLEWLNRTPFKNFLLPGILLLFFMAVLPAFTIIGLLNKRQNRWFHYLNIFRDKHWSWTFSLYIGIITIIWIAVQQLIAEYFILQPLISLTGVVILVFTLMPRVQSYYTLKGTIG